MQNRYKSHDNSGPGEFLGEIKKKAHTNWKNRVLLRLFLMSVLATTGIALTFNFVTEMIWRFLFSLVVFTVLFLGIFATETIKGGQQKREHVALVAVIGASLVFSTILLMLPDPLTLVLLQGNDLWVNLNVLSIQLVIFSAVTFGVFLLLSLLVAREKDVAREREINRNDFKNFFRKEKSEGMSGRRYFIARLLLLVFCNMIVLTLIMNLITDPLMQYLAATINAAVLMLGTVVLKHRKGDSVVNEPRDVMRMVLSILLKGSLPFVLGFIGMLIMQDRLMIDTFDGAYWLNITTLGMQIMLWVLVYVAMFAIVYVLTTD